MDKVLPTLCYIQQGQQWDISPFFSTRNYSYGPGKPALCVPDSAGVGLDGLQRSAELQPFCGFLIGHFSSGKLAPQHKEGIKLSVFRCITTVFIKLFFPGFSFTYLSSCNTRRSRLIWPKLVTSTNYIKKSERDTQNRK